jgi:quaternary ammonium compound-resistance protein SugE
MSNAWLMLIVAGLFEIGWAVGLKYTDGFTRPWPTAGVAAALIVSMILLSLAARTLPIGTAYAVWVGIGAAGAAVLGIVLFGEAVTAARVFFLALLLVAIVGLKLTA